MLLLLFLLFSFKSFGEKVQQRTHGEREASAPRQDKIGKVAT